MTFRRLAGRCGKLPVAGIAAGSHHPDYSAFTAFQVRLMSSHLRLSAAEFIIYCPWTISWFAVSFA